MSDTIALETLYSDDIFKAVGLLFLTSALVEQVVGFHVSRLIAHPNTVDGATVIALQGTEIKVRLHQIKMLARLRLAPQYAKEIASTCDRLRDSFNTRNALAHHANLQGSSHDKLVLYPARLKADGTLDREKPLHAQQIRELAFRMHTLAAELDAALVRAGVPRVQPV